MSYIEAIFSLCVDSAQQQNTLRVAQFQFCQGEYSHFSEEVLATGQQIGGEVPPFIWAVLTFILH